MVLCRRSNRGERRLHAFRMCKFKRSVHFVRRYVVEQLAFVFVGQCVPIFFGCLQKGKSAHNVGACERERIFNGAVDMTFGSEVYYAVDSVPAHNTAHLVKVGDVCFYKRIVRLILNVL